MRLVKPDYIIRYTIIKIREQYWHYRHFVDDPNEERTASPAADLHGPATGADITSLVLSSHRNQPGALFRLLQPFADIGLDLTRIESRPMKGAPIQDYFFFIDFAGHLQDAPVRSALDAVQADAAFFKILGSYPKAVL